MAKTIPVKDADFNVTQEIIIGAANVNRSQWGLDTVWIDTNLLPAQARWVAAWAAYQDANTRTPLCTFKKNEARAGCEKPLRILIHNLEANTKVTDNDRHAMGIIIRAVGHKPLPPPTDQPKLEIKMPVPRRLVLRFFNEGSNSHAKPHGVAGAVLRWVMQDTPPAEIGALNKWELDTQSPFTLDFDESERGRKVYFCAAWQNPTGAKGPWSDIVSAIIP
jgi:hypothetical protein